MTDSPPPKSQYIILTHEFAPFRGGAATYAEEIAAAFHRSGINLQLWAPDYHQQTAPENFPFPVLRVRSGGSLRLNDWLRWTYGLAVRRPNFNYASRIILASVGAHTAWFILNALGLVRNDRVISILHGSEVLRFQKNPLWRFLARRFYRQLGQVVTVSEFSRSLIQKSFIGHAVKKIVIAPCAPGVIAAQSVPPVPRSDDLIRILTLARLHPRKGQLDTARALANLPADLRRKIIYQVAGAGDASYLRQIENVCRSATVEFQYLGVIELMDLARTYAQCDIFAMTSRTLPNSVEGFGIAYLEAGCHGKPVIAYRSGGVAEAVRDGETGLLVPEGDCVALTGAFARLIADPQLRKSLGAANRKWSAKFSWSTTAQILFTLTAIP